MTTYRRPECPACNVPQRTEDEEVRERNTGLFRFSGEHTENGRIDVVLRYASHVGEFLQRIFIGNVTEKKPIRNSNSPTTKIIIYALSMPSHDVERCVLLGT